MILLHLPRELVDLRIEMSEYFLVLVELLLLPLDARKQLVFDQGTVYRMGIAPAVVFIRLIANLPGRVDRADHPRVPRPVIVGPVRVRLRDLPKNLLAGGRVVCKQDSTDDLVAHGLAERKIIRKVECGWVVVHPTI